MGFYIMATVLEHLTTQLVTSPRNLSDRHHQDPATDPGWALWCRTGGRAEVQWHAARAPQDLSRGGNTCSLLWVNKSLLCFMSLFSLPFINYITLLIVKSFLVCCPLGLQHLNIIIIHGRKVRHLNPKPTNSWIVGFMTFYQSCTPQVVVEIVVRMEKVHIYYISCSCEYQNLVGLVFGCLTFSLIIYLSPILRIFVVCCRIKPAVLRQATYGTIKFGIYYSLKQMLVNNPGEERLGINVFCAVTAGVSLLFIHLQIAVLVWTESTYCLCPVMYRVLTKVWWAGRGGVQCNGQSHGRVEGTPTEWPYRLQGEESPAGLCQHL